MDGLLVTLQKVLISVPFFSVIALLLFAGKKLFDVTTKYDFQEELTQRDNPAFGVMISGALTLIPSQNGRRNAIECESENRRTDGTT